MTVHVDGNQLTLPVTCTACGTALPVTLTLERPADAAPWLRTDPADLALTWLFARAHRGPFTVGPDHEIVTAGRILPP